MLKLFKISSLTKKMFIFIFFLYTVMETCNYINYKLFVFKINKLIVEKKMKPAYIDYFYSRLNDMNNFEIKQFIHNLFFKKIPIENILPLDIKNALARNLYFTSYNNCSLSEANNINKMTNIVQNKLFSNGNEINKSNLLTSINNDHILTDSNVQQFMMFGRNTLDPFYKPMLFYLAFKITKCYYDNFIFKKHNFKIIYKNGIMFYIKVVNSSLTPVLFFHGLGFGIIPYSKIITTIANDRTIVCPIFPNISNMYFNHDFVSLSCKNYTNTIKEIIADLHITKIDLIGHSMGTATMTQILNASNDNSFVNKKIYLDPICFHARQTKIFKKPYLSFYDNVKKYKNNEHLYSILISHYFVFVDVYVQILCKRFFWSDEITEIGKNIDNKCYLILSGKDHIVPSSEITKYINEKYINNNIKVNIIYNKDMHHTSILQSNNCNVIMKCLNQ